MPLLAPGETDPMTSEARPGTHWMHSHRARRRRCRLLAAPLIVRSREDLAGRPGRRS